MVEITATAFFQEWRKAVTNRREEMLSIWRNNKGLTSLVKGSENSILDEVALNLNLHCYPQDYYSIDAIFYENNDLTPGIRENTYWFREIKIAFEHENNFRGGLYQEVSHLLITNCELRVVVSYPDYEPDTELQYLHEIIKGTRISGETSEKENFLIICGYENGFEWEGYVYKEEGWKKISVENPAEKNLIEL